MPLTETRDATRIGPPTKPLWSGVVLVTALVTALLTLVLLALQAVM